MRRPLRLSATAAPPLQFSQSRRNRQPRRANGRQQSSDEADRQRIEQAGGQQTWRDSKREGDLAEGLKVHGRSLIAVERKIRGKAANEPTDAAQNNRFRED